MSYHSGWDGVRAPTLFRTVPASQDLTAVAGAPKRNAAVVVFENNDAAASRTAVAKCGVSTDTGATFTIPFQSVYPAMYGNWNALGALGTTVTCVAGWIDDGTVPINP